MRLTVAFLTVLIGYASSRPESDAKAEATADAKAEATAGLAYGNDLLSNGFFPSIIPRGPYLPGPLPHGDILPGQFVPGPIHGGHHGPLLPGPIYPGPIHGHPGNVRKVHITETKDVYHPPKVVTKTHTITKVEPQVHLEPIAHPKYEFGYGVHDPYHGTNFGHQERRDGYRTEGQYHVHLPDGRLQKVTYYADEFGYHPTITYE